MTFKLITVPVNYQLPASIVCLFFSWGEKPGGNIHCRADFFFLLCVLYISPAHDVRASWHRHRISDATFLYLST